MSDYISRESVLNTIEDMDKALDTDRTVEEYKALLIECVKALSSKDFTEELEKIKAEINNIEPGYNFEGFYYCQSKVLDIIDERIEELKGENNDR